MYRQEMSVRRMPAAHANRRPSRPSFAESQAVEAVRHGPVSTTLRVASWCYRKKPASLRPPNSFHAQCDLCRHRPLEILVDLVEESRRREPFLVGADEEGEVLRHVAGLDGVDADLLEGRGEAGEVLVVVELGAVSEAAGPGEDRSDRVGRGLLALLVLAVVARHGAVGGL